MHKGGPGADEAISKYGHTGAATAPSSECEARPPSKLESEESDDLFTQEGAVSEACRDEADSGEAKQVDRKRGE